MKKSREEIIEILTDQLDECLSSINGEQYGWDKRVIELNEENQTITLKLNYYVVEEDDYIGFGGY